ncbi:MAG: acetyl-CoA carboxylase biotin carboxyl carrier protein [Gammaproteobacteria bacterium]|nr:acetyl-CoA carboxylase biotin carboxyl carrier protein [Gammaproteobacteria bacterium]MBU6509796.1 acetyl-CoA carboxylase biotin carboxyl carrier protein [Gammaproteobacteria bacterium]MDE1983260.1 acetyl-CoA carboxylase biotin carboxyl carrier protein [Gammaproteobacteria bacterium]MDE2108453.1 acetyl-CoA carboxylase biotin carboxyl carrier protein [Gammaproteobacteria bacterium]
MDIRKVKKLIELLEESGIAEIEITEGEESVRISRYGGSAPAVTHAVAAPAVVAAAPAAATPAAAPAAAAPATAGGKEIPAGHQVKSPMVGTFYRSAAPGAKAFVDVGSVVKEGDTLCIIEAMKMMNQIEADKAGTVKAILANNGDPVEFGQPLIVIE